MSFFGPKVKQIAVFATILMLAATVLPSHPASAQDPDNGAYLYTFYGCIECHGLQAEGDFGPKIAAISVSLEEFLSQLRTPREEMDAYPDDFLTDEQAADIYTFLQTLPDPSAGTSSEEYGPVEEY